jgi:hypothetical protein
LINLLIAGILMVAKWRVLSIPSQPTRKSHLIMKKIPLTGMLLLALLNTAYAQDEVAPATMENGNFCLFAGAPASDVKYTIVKQVKLAKGSYGGVRELLPVFVAEAKGAGADAIINYAGTQRFGFFPWRLVRPVLRGTAVKWDTPGVVDCEKLGGMTLNAVIAANKAPENVPVKAPEQQ